jgi:hypothetical protein
MQKSNELLSMTLPPVVIGAGDSERHCRAVASRAGEPGNLNTNFRVPHLSLLLAMVENSAARRVCSAAMADCGVGLHCGFLPHRGSVCRGPGRRLLIAAPATVAGRFAAPCFTQSKPRCMPASSSAGEGSGAATRRWNGP